MEDRRHLWDLLEYVRVDWILEVSMELPNGEGDWLSKIIANRPVDIETRASEQNYQYVNCSQGTSAENREPTANSISEEDERVIGKLKLIIEANFDLHDLDDDSAPQETLVIDTLRVVINARERKIIERKVMSEESIEQQAMRSRSFKRVDEKSLPVRT